MLVLENSMHPALQHMPAGLVCNDFTLLAHTHNTCPVDGECLST